MADLRDGYGNPNASIRLTDEYGNPIIPQTDEYGNPIQQTGTVPGYGGMNPTGHTKESGVPVHGGMTATGHSTGTQGAVPGTVIGGGMNPTDHSSRVGHQTQHKEHHGLSGLLHRSGSSSSSSSSEDDGQGGRRKKKGLKEKIKEKLPGGHKTDEQTGGTSGHEQHEKKGMMEKIKEKLPGGTAVHEQHENQQTAGHDQQHETKGMMEKIKEKLPGHHHH